MSDLDFLDLYGHGEATVLVLLPDCTVTRIGNLHPEIISDKCPLLAYAFEDGPNGDLQATIDAVSRTSVASFLRFIYTGTYRSCHDADRPCSLLTHADVYKLAVNYDVPDLQVQAHVSLIHDVEMGVSMPWPPIDLCAAIRHVYKHLPDQQPIVEHILHYCVSCFKYHNLGTNAEFRRIAIDIPEFYRDLCQTSFARDFEDEGAPEIMRLLDPNPPATSAELHTGTRPTPDSRTSLVNETTCIGPNDAAEKPRMERRKYTLEHERPLALRFKNQVKSVAFVDDEPASGVARGKRVCRPGSDGAFNLRHRPTETFTATTKSGSIVTLPNYPRSYAGCDSTLSLGLASSSAMRSPVTAESTLASNASNHRAEPLGQSANQVAQETVSASKQSASRPTSPAKSPAGELNFDFNFPQEFKPASATSSFDRRHSLTPSDVKISTSILVNSLRQSIGEGLLPRSTTLNLANAEPVTGDSSSAANSAAPHLPAAVLSPIVAKMDDPFEEDQGNWEDAVDDAWNQDQDEESVPKPEPAVYVDIESRTPSPSPSYARENDPLSSEPGATSINVVVTRTPSPSFSDGWDIVSSSSLVQSPVMIPSRPATPPSPASNASDHGSDWYLF